ncbi:MAG: folate family ECF transporter S component [Oscillospiraceae bacterium]|nr:folate family ECF transporter S component [Oscillospiraceae bacterium]
MSKSATITRPASYGRMATRSLVACALLAAVSVVLARLIVPMPSITTRFSIEAVPIILAGLLFGPVAGCLVGFVADTVGCLFSGFGWNFVFSVPPMLIGLCAGLLRPLLCKKVTYLRILLTYLPAVVFGSILWQSYWLSAIYGSNTFMAFVGTRSIQYAITMPLNVAIVYLLFKSKVFSSTGFWPPVNYAPKKSMPQ